MTLDELRKALDELGLAGDTSVILQKDAEGNGYSPLDGADEAMYLAESTWSGETYMTDEQLQAKIKADPNGRWDPEKDGAPEGAVRVIVLWSVN
jgi:hypothetical protein